MENSCFCSLLVCMVKDKAYLHITALCWQVYFTDCPLHQRKTTPNVRCSLSKQVLFSSLTKYRSSYPARYQLHTGGQCELIAACLLTWDQLHDSFSIGLMLRLIAAPQVNSSPSPPPPPPFSLSLLVGHWSQLADGVELCLNFVLLKYNLLQQKETVWIILFKFCS